MSVLGCAVYAGYAIIIIIDRPLLPTCAYICPNKAYNRTIN